MTKKQFIVFLLCMVLSMGGIAALWECENKTWFGDAITKIKTLAAQVQRAIVSQYGPWEDTDWQFAFQINASCSRHIEEIKRLQADVKAVQGQQTAANTLEPYNRMLLTLNRIGELASLHRKLHRDAMVKAAAGRCLVKLRKEVFLARDRWEYNAIASVKEKGLDAGAARFRMRLLSRLQTFGANNGDNARDTKGSDPDEAEERFEAKPTREGMIQLLRARWSAATRAGYKSWADRQAKQTSFGSAAVAGRFLTDMEAMARPRQAWEWAEVLGHGEGRIFKPSASMDCNYYRMWLEQYTNQYERNLLLSKQVNFATLVPRALAILERLFSLQFVPTRQKTWGGADARIYEVFSSEHYLGRMYLVDNSSEASCTSIHQCDHSRRTPCTFVFANLHGFQPWYQYVKYDDVGTLFHELGHAVHFLVSARKKWMWDDWRGGATELDELPSQLLELWIKRSTSIARLANVREDDIAPKSVRAGLRLQRRLEAMWTLFAAKLEHHLHSTWIRNRSDLRAVLDGMGDAYPRCDAWSLAAEVVSSGRPNYRYLASEVLARDVLSKVVGTLEHEAHEMQRFRKVVLEPWGTRGTLDLVQKYLGRDVTLSGYNAWIN